MSSGPDGLQQELSNFRGDGQHTPEYRQRSNRFCEHFCACGHGLHTFCSASVRARNRGGNATLQHAQPRYSTLRHSILRRRRDAEQAATVLTSVALDRFAGGNTILSRHLRRFKCNEDAGFPLRTLELLHRVKVGFCCYRIFLKKPCPLGKSAHPVGKSMIPPRPWN